MHGDSIDDRTVKRIIRIRDDRGWMVTSTTDQYAHLSDAGCVRIVSEGGDFPKRQNHIGGDDRVAADVRHQLVVTVRR
jgi:hypothetical protein